MAQILCPQLKREVSVTSKKSVMDTLLNQGIPVASSCKGDGICGKCKIFMTSPQPLPKMSELEQKTLKNNEGQPGERLSCQLYVDQDITLTTTYW